MLVLHIKFSQKIKFLIFCLVLIYIRIDILNGNTYYYQNTLSNNTEANLANISSDNSVEEDNQQLIENSINNAYQAAENNEGLDSIFPKGQEGHIRTAEINLTKSFYTETIDSKDFQNDEWKSFDGITVQKGATIGFSVDTTNLPKSDLGQPRPNLQPDDIKYILYRVDPRFEKPVIMVYEGENNIEQGFLESYYNKTIYDNSHGVQDKISIPAHKLAVFHLKEVIHKKHNPKYREYNDFYFDNIIPNGGGIAYKPPYLSFETLQRWIAQSQMDFEQEEYSCPSPVIKSDVISGGYLSECGCTLINEDQFKHITDENSYSNDHLAVFSQNGMTEQCKKCIDWDKINTPNNIFTKNIPFEEYDGLYVKNYVHQFPIIGVEDAVQSDREDYYFTNHLFNNGCFNVLDDPPDCSNLGENTKDQDLREGLKCSSIPKTDHDFNTGRPIPGSAYTEITKDGYANCKIFSTTADLTYTKEQADINGTLFSRLNSTSMTQHGADKRIKYINSKGNEEEVNNSDTKDNKPEYLKHVNNEFNEYKAQCNCRKTVMTKSKAEEIITRKGLKNLCKIKNLEDNDMAIIATESNKENCMKILNLDSNYTWSSEKNLERAILGYENINGKIEYLNVSDHCAEIIQFAVQETGLHTYTGAPSNNIVLNPHNISLCNGSTNQNDLCLYNGGAGITINSSGNMIKPHERQFAHNQFHTINHTDQLMDQKKFFYYLNNSDYNLNITLGTELLIEHMFLPNEIVQFANDWPTTHENFFAKIIMNPLHILFLHFGSYLMRMETYPIENPFQRIKIEYIISPTAPDVNTKGNNLYFDAKNPTPQSISANQEGGKLWYKVYSESSTNNESLGIDSGSIVLNVETIKKNNFFSNFIYNNIILYLIENMKNTIAGTFSYLSENAFLRGIAVTTTTLYVIFYGLFFITGVVNISANDVIQRLTKIAIIFSVFFNQQSWSFFNNYLFTIFVEGYNYITTLLLSNDYIVSGEEITPFSWADVLLGKFFNFNTFSMILYQAFCVSFGYFIITIILIVGLGKFLWMIFRVTVEYVISFSMLAITISIAPLFFILILFEYTRKFFLQWTKMLLGFLLFAIILILFILLVSTVFDHFFTKALIPQIAKLNAVHFPINIIVHTFKIFMFEYITYQPQTSINYSPDLYNPTTSFIYSFLFYISGNISSKISSIVSSLIRSIFGLGVYVYR